MPFLCLLLCDYSTLDQERITVQKQWKNRNKTGDFNCFRTLKEKQNLP